MAKFKDLNIFFSNLDNKFLHGIVPIIIAEEATKFYKQRFTAKADINNSPWPEAKNPPTRGSLMVRSGNLVASIRPSKITSTRVIISAGSNRVPYARIHNEGGIIKVPVTKNMRKFAWAMKYKTGNDKWKYLAISKKQVLQVKIPQRQFIGHSQALKSLLTNIIKKAYKQYLNNRL